MGSHLETKLKAVIESITDGVYMSDANGTCIACNYAFKRLTGINIDLVGKHVSYLLDHNLISEAVTVETIATRRHVSKVIKYPSGCEALVTGNPVFDTNGRLISVVAIVKDLTELNALKDELKKSKGLAQQYMKTLKSFNAPLNISSDGFIIRDAKMQRVLDLIQRVSDSDVTVMIYGESGVGKGMIADLIHTQSHRSSQPFIKVDCGAIPAALLESELFGYERGAFTGARQEGKLGLFELANHGTLFLDEIGEMPVSLQVKLLNVLQDRRILHVGGTKPFPIDVRILCATNRNLEQMVAEGSFRSDLYYRLNVVPLTILPLRERKEDILVLTVSFLDKACKKYNRRTKIAPEVMDCFLEYAWPGNVRELENTIERLVVLDQDGTITLDDLPEKMRSQLQNSAPRAAAPDRQIIPLKTAVAETERQLLELALQQRAPLAAVAEGLGIDLSTLLRKSKKYGIKRADLLAKMQ